MTAVAEHAKASKPTTSSSPASQRRLSVLVAIASYGTAQDQYLRQVVAQFHALDMDCRIVVLSNIDKHVDGAETLVGLPSRNTYSLPFAHRALFRRHVNDHDLFIYTEDDTLITPHNIRAFLEVQEQLRETEVVGFLRSESAPDGTRYVVSANSHFRWLPNSGFQRGPHSFGQFSNHHSGCFIVTRKHLTLAIASGGFTVEPRTDRYGMLETAASDVYTQCGLTRVICLSRLDDFVVPHLANKYHGRMGLPIAEFALQVQAVRRLMGSSTGTLFDPQTRAPGFRWSKHLYGPANAQLLNLVPSYARHALSFGATMGNDEADLVRRGLEVDCVPLDTVFADTLARRGFAVHQGSPDRPFASLPSGTFDVVLAPDVLHLVRDPLEWLRSAHEVLRPGGEVAGSVSNTGSWLWALKDWRMRRHWVRPTFEGTGAHPMTASRLSRIARSSGFDVVAVLPSTDEAPRVERIPMKWVRDGLAPRLLYRLRKRPLRSTPSGPALAARHD